MKNVAVIFLLFIAFTAFSQDEEYSSKQEIKTIFSKDTKINGYGAFDMLFTNLSGHNTLMLGGHGGVIFNKSFLLGFSGMGISTSNSFRSPDQLENYKLSGGYGGIMLGYILMPNEIFHLTFPVTLGMGAMDVVNADYRYGSLPTPDQFNSGWVVESSLFLLFEPGAQLEINIAKFFRLGIGASYRFTEGLDLPVNRIGDEEAAGLNANLSFKFGYF